MTIAKQRKIISFVESTVNAISGIIIGALAQMVVFPWFDIPPMPAVDHVAIAMIFAVTSVIRGYVLRRVFNHYTHKNKALD